MHTFLSWVIERGRGSETVYLGAWASHRIELVLVLVLVALILILIWQMHRTKPREEKKGFWRGWGLCYVASSSTCIYSRTISSFPVRFRDPHFQPFDPIYTFPFQTSYFLLSVHTARVIVYFFLFNFEIILKLKRKICQKV